MIEKKRLTELDPSFQLCVDTTEIPIQRPPDEIQEIFYSGKSERHTLKYEVAVRVNTPFKIVWVAGPFPGSMHDLTIIRNSGLLQSLEQNERVIGDPAYVGEPALITTFKGTTRELEIYFNCMLSKMRVISENVFDRFKIFSILTDEWRLPFSLENLEK